MPANQEIICDPTNIISSVNIEHEPANLNELSWYALSDFERKNVKFIFNIKREFRKNRDYKNWLFDFAEYVNLKPSFFEKYFPFFGVRKLRKRVDEVVRGF